MSKKDYQAIAAAIYRMKVRPEMSGRFGAFNELIAELALTFQAGNPRFDRARFIEACETGACKGMKRREVA